MIDSNRKLCMVLCHICQIYGIWRSKKVWDALMSSFGVEMQATRGRGTNLIGKRGFPLCNTAVLKLYCKSYLELKKIL